MNIKKLSKLAESESLPTEQGLVELEGATCNAAGTHDITTIEVESKSQTSQQTLADQEGAMCRTTGTHNIETAVRIVTQVRAAQVWPEPETEDRIQSFAGAFASIGEMAPQNATEAMLATQMIAAHEASLKFLHLSTLEGQHSEYIDANLLRATRLMRLFSQQAETMQKLKGKAAPPNLIVGHVDVHHGGQAILGSATVSKGEAQ